MTALDFFALFVLLVVTVVAVAIALVLGALPGKIAGERGHRQADAIRLCGWLGLLTLGLLWPFALVWAYTDGDGSDHNVRLDEIEERLERLESDRAGQGGARP